MVPLTKSSISFARHFRLFQGHGLDRDLGLRQKQREVARAFVAKAVINDDRRLK
jgi:hypothetical protein